MAVYETVDPATEPENKDDYFGVGPEYQTRINAKAKAAQNTRAELRASVKAKAIEVRGEQAESGEDEREDERDKEDVEGAPKAPATPTAPSAK